MGGQSDELAVEAAKLKQQIRDAQKASRDTKLSNEIGSVGGLKLNLRARKTLRGHLSKVFRTSTICN